MGEGPWGFFPEKKPVVLSVEHVEVVYGTIKLSRGDPAIISPCQAPDKTVAALIPVVHSPARPMGPRVTGLIGAGGKRGLSQGKSLLPLYER